ncbi:MAG: VIT1/CCC1 transporter family protein [Candidatus Eremiobacteraeota bacterium]|nr:VIT1/CCC1 transporter family protein [Candidatus Eremiobacteraeota bacterium]
MSALTIGGSYVLGGIVPLLPYMLIADAIRALYVSAGFTLLALFAFGAIKGRLTRLPWIRSAFQTVAIGGVAAAVAFGIARLVNGGH